MASSTIDVIAAGLSMTIDPKPTYIGGSPSSMNLTRSGGGLNSSSDCRK
jgi:hypothetical protein